MYRNYFVVCVLDDAQPKEIDLMSLELVMSLRSVSWKEAIEDRVVFVNECGFHF